MQWTLFTLAFVLGYLVCKGLYFYRAARTSLLVIKATHVISLAILAKSLEDFYYAKVYRMEKMVEADETIHNITAFSLLIEDEISYYKKKAIKNIIKAHPELFKHLIEFDDWESAMLFLQTHKDLATYFLKRSEND